MILHQNRTPSESYLQNIIKPLATEAFERGRRETPNFHDLLHFTLKRHFFAER